MSHLNEQLSALVDSELTGAELDRANAHLASCEQCRTEAAALRLLKRELRGLVAVPHSDDLTRRLLAMAGPGGPVPPRGLNATSRPRPAFRAYPDRPGPRRGSAGDQSFRFRPPPRSPSDIWARRGRGRGLAWGAASLVVSVGLAACAYTLSGAALPSGARIPPQMELTTIVHAVMNGNVPMLDPGQPAKLKQSPGTEGNPRTPTP